MALFGSFNLIASEIALPRSPKLLGMTKTFDVNTPILPTDIDALIQLNTYVKILVGLLDSLGFTTPKPALGPTLTLKCFLLLAFDHFLFPFGLVRVREVPTSPLESLGFTTPGPQSSKFFNT
jgi:hypothetical protein